MNCARRTCGHPEGIHDGRCLACDCPQLIFTPEPATPMPPADDDDTLDFDRSDEETKP